MAGLIPQAFIDEVLARTDIVELIDGYVPLKKQGNSFVARCPFHSEKTPSFNVVANKQFYHCFGCGASGNAISFMMDYLKQDFITTVETLAAKLSMEVPRDEKTKQQQQFSQDHYQLLDKVSRYYQQQLPQSPQAIDYLKSRGLSGEIAKHYQLGYAPEGWHHLESIFKHERKGLLTTGMLIEKDDGNHYDRYRNRIMFPIHDKRGRIIGFGGRTIKPDDKPKYLNSPETVLFQKGRELYGLHQAIQGSKQLPFIVVVEGYMDVIALAQHGITSAVATLGTATSQAHIQLMARHTQQLIFCFDGDEAGKQAAWRALEASFSQLVDGLDIRFIFLPQGQDPDSLIRQESQQGFLSRLKSAQPLNDFFFASLLKEIDTSTLSGKTQLANKAQEYLNKIPSGAYQDLLLQQLARLTHLDIDRLRTLIDDKKPLSTPVSQAKSVPSNLKLIIALLLQNPSLHEQVSPQIDDTLLEGKNLAVLKELLTILNNEPNLNTAGLVEKWRNHQLFEVMKKLAAWQHHVPEEGVEQELLGAIKQLQLQIIKQKIDTLLQQAAHQSLTNEEKRKLQTMIQQRLAYSTNEKT